MNANNQTNPPLAAARATALVDGAEPIDFDIAVDRLRTANTFVLSTTHTTGQPHAVPLFAVWADGALHFAAADSTQKARNLAADLACVMTSSSDGSDLVVEGHARRVIDEQAVQRVAAAYLDKYGWDPEPEGAELHAPGAPTAGAPPYALYRVEPDRVFAFPNDDDHTPTRWSLEEPTSSQPS